jgi:DNA-dependent RNA polymerase auxiliary subunit epsilon
MSEEVCCIFDDYLDGRIQNGCCVVTHMIRTMTQQTIATEVQWDKSCKALDEEFQLNASELPTIETTQALFLQVVGRREISQEAANALMFSLYFSSYLSMLLSFKQQSPEFEVPDYLHTHPVLEASNRWAQLAPDGHLLVQLAQPIIRDTQDLLDALN